MNEERHKSENLRNPSRRRSPRSPNFCPCSTTTLFIPMSVPRPNATGFLFHEKPDALLVSRSQAQDIVHMASGSGSSVETTGAPRDLSRAQHPVSPRKIPDRSPGVPHTASLPEQSSQRVIVAFLVLSFNPQYGSCLPFSSPSSPWRITGTSRRNSRIALTVGE